MPSTAYSSFLTLVSKYVEPKKAAEVLQRQLTACNLNADSISVGDIKTNSQRLVIAFGLYISESAKRDELSSKIAAM